ncbi:MAG: nylB [Geminicoccaceae bacterium]|nr:nylB [Geminicoccaceae bacterium]
MNRRFGLGAAVCAVVLSSPAFAQSASDSLIGLWYAKLRFGPDVRGRLVLDRVTGVWRAAIAGRTAAVRTKADSLAFDVPGDGGAFVGSVRSGTVVGRWISPSRTSTPLVLTACGVSCYDGDVVLDDDAFTFYLKVSRLADGTLSAFLRNPERNLGGPWFPVKAIRRDGEAIALLDRNGKAISSGPFRNGVMSIPLRGGTYDFRRLPDSAYADFYPRGRPTVKYRYAPPRQDRDGWEVARLRDVGISEDSIAAVVQSLIDLPIDSVYTPQAHALLIARHGKLVLEEYFHGEHADKPHDTRSASKTHVTALIGAAMLAGVRITPETRVYATLRPNVANLPPRKQAMTLEHVLTMTAGYDCDDSGDRPGDEDVITQQDTNPDWTALILDLDVVRDPGTVAVYCSIEPFIAGEVLARVSGRALPDLFDELVARPLDMRRYSLGLTPLGRIWFGGGHRFVARDFLKLPQLYLNGGTWRGRRILSKEWVSRSLQPRYRLGSRAYGYLWWMKEYPYHGRTIRAYMQLGNGSQNAILIPELDLVIATFGANYNSPSINYLLDVLIPTRILPAVEPVR